MLFGEYLWVRACLHGDRVTLLEGLPFYKGQKIAAPPPPPFLYMQSLGPSAIAIIEFGTERDNCAAAKNTTTKWRKCKVFWQYIQFSLRLPLWLRFFHCCGFLLSYLLIQKRRISRQSYSNPSPQKFTLLGGWPYLKCLHGKRLALPGGLPYP